MLNRLSTKTIIISCTKVISTKEKHTPVNAASCVPGKIASPPYPKSWQQSFGLHLDGGLEHMHSMQSLGQISSLDFRKAQVDLEGSINGYNEALYSAKIAEMELLKLAGLFLDEL